MSDKHAKNLRPSTAVLHAGFDPMLSVGSARPAVFRSSTYCFSSPEAAERAFDVAHGAEAKPGENVELIYSRLSHPNAEIFESQVIALEPGATCSAVFNSGLSAISTLFFTIMQPGKKYIYTTPLYGGTIGFYHGLAKKLGFEGIPCPSGDTQKLNELINATDDLAMVYMETPSNPTLMMTDIASAVETAKTKSGEKPLVVVDNTFMGPTFQHPFNHGADLVVYSATKYLAGFSDLVAGVVMGKETSLMKKIVSTRTSLGTILPPDECWLLNSRLPTVELRMNRQSKSAERLVNELKNHPKINRVGYPSLFEDKEQIRIRDKQCAFPGGIFTFEVKGGKKAAFDFLRNVGLCKLAVSLGGMESLITHPATTISCDLDEETRQKAGITDGLLRVSVGIEDWNDLLEDFNRTLDMI